MEEDAQIAAGIPLPVSTAGSPLVSPRPWFKGGSIFSSPQSGRLSIIEIVPPTPPSRSRPVNMDSPGPSPISPSSRRRAMNRMSRTFHAGTPPPAIRMLHPNDAKSPISNTFVRDGRRSSIASGSRRQSMLSMHDVDFPGHMQERLSMHLQDQEAGRARPILEHMETLMSEDTYVSQGTDPTTDPTWRTSSSSGGNSMRVDPLTLLERRRRRDYTIGSHNPHHPPPNTPESSILPPESDPEEIQSVKLGELIDRFKSVFTGFADMPWVAEPCVATLVIPQSVTKEAPPVGWYRKKPSLDEILGETMEEGNVDHDESLSETIVSPPPIPRKEAKWFPKRPEPGQFFGRERFSDVLVTRAIVRH